MSDFDDPDLRRRLRDVAGPEPDTGLALDSVGLRVRAAQRRRTAITGAIAAALVVLVAGAALWRSGDSTPRLRTASPDTAEPTIAPTSVSAVITSPSSTVAVSTSIGATSTTSGSIAPVPATADAAPTAAPPTAAPPPSPQPSPATTDPAPPPPTTVSTSSLSSVGGSITVRLEGGVLELVSVDPASGFVVDQTNTSPDRVEVRFRADTHESRIEVTLVDGQMVPVVEERSDD